MAIIKAPNEQYSGVSASLRFVNGKAETNDKWLIQWFKSKGYEIDDSAERKAAVKPKKEADKENADAKAKEEAESKSKEEATEKPKKDKDTKKEGE